MQSETRNPLGRPSFKPTTMHRKQVLLLASRGYRQADIAAFLTISPKTLRKHFRAEINLGYSHANAVVLERLYALATSGKSYAAMKFWAKTRCGVAPEKKIYSPAGGLTNRREKNPSD